MIFLNGQRFDPTVFPNGEIGFQLETDAAVNILWRYDGDEEIVHLKMIADHFAYAGTRLIIEYLPYSRMDRVKGDWGFSLRSVCDILNSCNFGHIWVAEPHSDVCMALLRNATPYYPTALQVHDVIRATFFHVDEDYLVFPDAGAEKRYGDDFAPYVRHRMTGFKSRDYDTGKIKRFGLVNHSDPGGEQALPVGRKAIIVDDLCSYGGTFLATAETLRDQYGIENVTLLVAHLENSVLDGKLIGSDLITSIWATNSIFRGYPNASFGKIHLYERFPQ